MAFMVIHLWGKFWMAAWRGRRWLTWMTGVVAFVASVVECFTGYLSQQNFDSQWIATNGKDAFNAAGVGAFFNLMNFGQMLLWHVVLIPVVLIALVGAHVLLVRMRGVSHPLPAQVPGAAGADVGGLRELARPGGPGGAAGTAGRRGGPWRGPTRRYDILKEGTIAALVALVLTVGLASRAVVARRAAGHGAQLGAGRAGRLPRHRGHRAGRDERDRRPTGRRTTPTATSQSELFAPANIAGVRQPIDTAQTFVLQPLAKSRDQPTRARGGARAVQRGPGGAAEQVGDQLRQRGRRRSRSSTAPRWCPGPTTARSRSCSPPS